MSASEESAIKFSVMVSLFKWMQKSKSSIKKRSKFRKFLDAYCRRPGDYFSAIRLILPALDRERGSYGLKEHALATSLIDALGMSKDSPDAQRLLNWRKGGPKTGFSAGNFSLVAFEVLQVRQAMTSGELTLKKLNELLDRLASTENRGEKTSVLSELIRNTNAQELRWIIMIILKDLKLGISEKSIFHEFHPDAEDLFNVTCDLKLVCEKLRDRTQRHKRQDIEVGKPVRPQLALRVSNVNAAWKKLHGKDIVVECKFDGDRIQIHKNRSEVHYFSRNFLDHQEYGPGMSDIIASNVLVDRCILDGEMLVWDSSANCFAEFGSNQEIAKAAREGLDSDRQLCYVAFDILYMGDTSVIHQTLKERHDLLRKVVSPVKGRFEILVPKHGLNAKRPAGEPCWSLIAQSMDDAEKFFKETIENRDEGIILKDLGSKWEPSDRSAKWLKLKPEYVRAGSDLDVLIIGGYYGSGRHGGEVAQFLVGLAERTTPNTHPRRFISFCRVGTGLSDEELDAVVTKLKPYFRKNEYPKKAPPSFYQVTNNSKERPDVWIESPEKSIIVSITSDIRTIKSEVFSAPYSLRFPRIDRVRFDKPWHECLDVQTFIEMVHSSNGTTQREEDDEHVDDHKPKRLKSQKHGDKNLSSVPHQFIRTDVSDVKSETLIFSKMVFYIANVPSSHSLDSMHKLVVKNGGSFSMNLNSSVTHSIAAESRGIKFQAARSRGDVIHYSWLLDCCSQKKLLPLQPKYFLNLSEVSKLKLQEEMDEFSDSYFVNVDIADIRQILSNICIPDDSNMVEYYKTTYCHNEKWARFSNCCVYFVPPLQSSLEINYRTLSELTLRRLKLEVSFCGGNVTENISNATTHIVVISDPELCADPCLPLTSLLKTQKCFISNRRIHIVESKWLEDCIEKNQKLPEDEYKLKNNTLEQFFIERIDDQELSLDVNSKIRTSKVENISLVNKEKTGRKSENPNKEVRLVTLPPKSDGKRKRGRPAGRKTCTNPPRKIPMVRRGSKSAKISDNNSDDDSMLSDTEAEKNAEIHDKHKPTFESRNQVVVTELSPKVNPVDHGIGPSNKNPIDHGIGPSNKIPVDHGIGPSNKNPVDNEIGPSYKNPVDHGIGPSNKIPVDPFQAMLESMIPRLSDNSKVKNSDSVTTGENIQLGDNSKVKNTDSVSTTGENIQPGHSSKVKNTDFVTTGENIRLGDDSKLKTADSVTTGENIRFGDDSKLKTADSVTIGENNPVMSSVPTTSTSSVIEDEGSNVEPTIKKKKVSYKDIAAKFLSDW